jgi:hypothetical protein
MLTGYCDALGPSLRALFMKVFGIRTDISLAGNGEQIPQAFAVLMSRIEPG